MTEILGESSSGNLEARHLVTLAAVSRARSFSKAADFLGFTQSAVSQQMARLEAAVGQQLIERPGGPRQIALTAAGEILCGHAEAIVARLASAKADLAAYKNGERGLLRIGCFQSVGVRILPNLIREFTTAWPNVRVELTEKEDDGELLRSVEDGSLDLTFVVFPLIDGPFASRRLLDDPYVVVVHPDSELAKQSGPVGLDQLEGLSLVTYDRMRQDHAIANRLGRPDVEQRIAFRSHDNGTILGLVEQGVGTALISWLSVDPNREGIRIRPLDGVNARTVGVAWHRDRHRNPAVDEFVRIAAERTRLATFSRVQNKRD